MNATIITPDLAIGSYSAIVEMQATGWQCICLTNEGGEVPCHTIPMNDGGGNSAEKIEAAIKWVLDVWKSGNKAYVCCRYGMNRSVSIGAAAMAVGRRVEWFSNALAMINRSRSIAGPRDDTMSEILLVVMKLKQNG